MSLTSVDLTTLGEAHGMIVDLLADSSLPQSVINALKVISDMLSPLLHQSFNRNSFSTSLVTVLEKTQVHVDEASVKDQPDLKDDTPLSLKNVSSCRNCQTEVAPYSDYMWVQKNSCPLS